MGWNNIKLWDFLENAQKNHDFHAKKYNDDLSGIDRARSDFYEKCKNHITTRQELLDFLESSSISDLGYQTDTYKTAYSEVIEELKLRVLNGDFS